MVNRLVWKFTNDRPIYLQILEQIQEGIVSGEYPIGSSIPSVRVMASDAKVNPNTMQRALQELESQGLLYTQRTTGRTVTEDGKMIEKIKISLAETHIDAFFAGMKSLGIEKDEAIEMLCSGMAETPPKGADRVDLLVDGEVN